MMFISLVLCCFLFPCVSVLAQNSGLRSQNSQLVCLPSEMLQRSPSVKALGLNRV